MPSYAADFETTTDADDCRVWAWAVCEVGNERNIQYGIDIASFFDWCELHAGSRVYFHNLKFDGKFLLSHLLMNDWRWIPVKTECDARTFTTLISDMSQFYSIKIWFRENRAVEFLDSLKMIPLPIKAIPRAFGFEHEEAKGEIDYKAYREVGHELTHEETEYITSDVVIAAKALDSMFKQKMKRMTAGSNAFHGYQEMIGGRRRFRDWFPEPDYDDDLRSGGCYKGGFTAVNPVFAGRIVGAGCSFDVNSLYPSVMASAHGEVLPYGEPVAYVGEYVQDDDYPLFIQYIEADFTVKADHIPCLQLKGCSMFAQTEYIRDSKGYQTMCLTSVDLQMLFEQYDVHDIRYIRGYKFKGSTLLFRDYVDYWTRVKTQATLEGNEGMRTIAKLMLNSLYGKLATNPVKRSKRPYLGEDGVVKYKLLEEEYAEAIYLPVGAFITSYARAFTITAAQKNYGRWLYSDTDSCYFLGTDNPKGMWIDDVELGAWKRETVFERFKAIRAKTYCYEPARRMRKEFHAKQRMFTKRPLTVHCAGMPVACHSHVTMDNFEVGASFAGKLKPKDVSGGIILEDGYFTIKK